MSEAESQAAQIDSGAAAAIVEEFGEDLAVVVVWSRAKNRLRVVTYGTTAKDKVHAATAGELCSKALGCDSASVRFDEDFRLHGDAAALKESLDILAEIYNRQGATAPTLQKIERLLMSVGRGVRSGG